MRAQISKAIQEALQGSHKIQITFKSEMLTDIPFLLGMNHDHIVSLSNYDESMLKETVLCNNWDDNHDRTLTVILSDTFDKNSEYYFTKHMWRALEKIEAVN